VTAVVHVLPRSRTDDTGLLFAYDISRTPVEVRRGGKSHYHPVEMSRVLREIRAMDEQVLLVGVPCFIKPVRNLTRHEKVLRERIRYTAAIFCGHLKSTGYTGSCSVGR
jgi:coenzyme F420 hydrogenase subunit beta